MHQNPSWVARPSWRAILIALVLWVVPVLPGLLIGPFRVLFGPLPPSHRAAAMTFSLLVVLLAAASILYMWWAGSTYKVLLWLGSGWALLSFLFHLVFGHYVLKASWSRLWGDYHLLQQRIWPLTLLTVFVVPVLVGVIRDGLKGLQALRAWLRTTRTGILVVLVIWLVGAQAFNAFVIEPHARWLAKATVYVRIKQAATHVSYEGGVVSLVATFIILLGIILLPLEVWSREAWRSYRNACLKALGAAVLIPGLFYMGARFDLESMRQSLEIEATLKAGGLEVGVTGSYLALTGVLVSLGTWVWLARGRRVTQAATPAAPR